MLGPMDFDGNALKDSLTRSLMAKVILPAVALSSHSPRGVQRVRGPIPVRVLTPLPFRSSDHV